MCSVPGTVPRNGFELSHCILTATFQGRRYCYAHFTDGEIKPQREATSLGLYGKQWQRPEEVLWSEG